MYCVSVTCLSGPQGHNKAKKYFKKPTLKPWLKAIGQTYVMLCYVVLTKREVNRNRFASPSDYSFVFIGAILG